MHITSDTRQSKKATDWFQLSDSMGGKKAKVRRQWKNPQLVEDEEKKICQNVEGF